MTFRNQFHPVLLSRLVLLAAVGCTEDGTTPDCGMGGRGSFEDAQCLTPIGGTCLTRTEFEKDRPNRKDENWEKYMRARPLCDFSDDADDSK